MQLSTAVEGMREFQNLNDALDHQIDQGGWVYALDGNARTFWFPETVSAYRIMLYSPALYLAGRLIADPARTITAVA
ncbi:hypothetical protein [Halomonas sp. KO116]|uniref:hypothetical protein n=1 Tax=Halomonas sp. KO116 TaxID=1504981 RepID=UPI0004E36822|nr:hypothetical protein [Halomonas sp. KO116]AJY53179.1 hypothetical protein KO116_P200072 [Halomonas sp. KO116]